MIDVKFFESDGLIIWKRDSRFYLRYDAGAHQVVIREDEISEDEVKLVIQGGENITKVLFALQERLIASGIKPYISNVK